MTADSGSSAHADEHSLTNPKYRPDIDGLRGIAVLAVIGFHAFPRFFQGGFVGVDIFFVISGFLISSILFRNFEKNSFSYAEFYARRIKRIFPALILVLAPCLIFGWLILPSEFRQLGKHVAAGAGFVSNFAFWREAGYFDESAETKPLLHLWSLGIEEQFYIFWPLLLGICWRRKLNFLTITLLIAFASFATNLFLVQANPVAAFYSPLSRFWELMIGGLLAYLTIHRSQKLPKQSAWVSLSGFLLVVTSIALVDSEKPFPGWWGLLPTIGTFLIISAGPSNWVNRRVLNSRILVAIGLISYPLYLWHWPILYAARRLVLFRLDETKATLAILASIALSVLLSWLTYRIVEVPIRFGSLKNRATRPLVLAMALLLAAGVVTYDSHGFGFRYPREVMGILDYDFESATKASYREGACFLRPEQGPSQFAGCTSPASPQISKSVLLWGDSHAAHLYPGFVHALGPQTQLTQLTASGCPPILGIKLKGRRHCRGINDFVLDYVSKAHPDYVILAGRWSLSDWTLIGGTVAQLKKLQISHIYLVGPVPAWGSGLPSALFKYARNHRDEPALPDRMTFRLGADEANIDKAMADFARSAGIAYLSPYKILCNVDGCLTRVGNTPDAIVAWDSTHLTNAGSRYVVSRFDSGLMP
jgi:peptidoglycan/LPS O-acetylase OafA/YrhL